MAYVTLSNITVLDNPSAFTKKLCFEVTFECAHALDDDLEWRVTYVGSAEDESKDQVLEEVLVGPVPVGTNKFILEAEPPNPNVIPEEDKVGVTVVLVTCSYRSREFVRVGYYVNNDYADPVLLENPPAQVDINKLQRNILAEKPRVTRFPIDWSPSGVAGGATSMDDNMDGEGMDIDGAEGDDEELVKAAAQLDHNYTDIVIGNSGANVGVNEEIDLEEEDDDDEDDDEEDDVEEDLETEDGDQDMEEVEPEDDR